jgi:hypothetical protein
MMKGQGWPFTRLETVVMVFVGAMVVTLISTIGLAYGLSSGIAVGLVAGVILKRRKEKQKL